ncbi:MAG TPA: metal-dependent hydrolase [Hyphomonadaceae bacterium]|nr:metal-dependent hydrolase [Hyphomonadaceae bacterium UKL13-1]HCP64452.1 metal-dependent hydrolase [Hyphomonadaceae bacterium]
MGSVVMIIFRKWLVACLALAGLAITPQSVQAQEPIIDMHLHASTANEQGPAPLAMCTPMDPMPAWDQTTDYETFITAWFKNPKCANPIWSPTTDDEIRTKTLEIMNRRNIFGVVSDKYARLKVWKAAAPDRIMNGLLPELPPKGNLTKEFAEAKAAGIITMIGELGTQYIGIAPNDPRMEPIWAAAEANDLPVALHVGPGPPGVAYAPGSGYRARLSSPLLLEDVLVKHPKLRINVMHAGFPMLDDTLALMYAHPQVYLDTGVIVYTQPKPAFYRYLQALVEAGFGERIMFGSDQMVWPETIEVGIKVIEDAPFLSAQQKRDILYNNAARFLRLDEATRAKHRAMGTK